MFNTRNKFYCSNSKIPHYYIEMLSEMKKKACNITNMELTE